MEPMTLLEVPPGLPYTLAFLPLLPDSVTTVPNRALLDALEAAPSLRPALDVSSTAPGVQVPSGETPVVDDPRWAET